MRKYILLRAVKSTTGPYPPTSADPDPRPTKSTSPTVGDGMLPPELDFGWMSVLLLQNPRNPTRKYSGDI